MRIKKKLVRGKTYYFEHSMREGKKVQKKEKYLGRKIPSDIEKIKKDFVGELLPDKPGGLLTTVN